MIKKQQDVKHAFSQRNSQSKGNNNFKFEDILDLVHEEQMKLASNLFADQCPMKITEELNRINSQKTLLQEDIDIHIEMSKLVLVLVLQGLYY